MPSPHLAETERNPGSSRHHATYGSLPGLNSNHVVPSIATQHNGQVQMPIPTVHGETPLKRITMSPQLPQGSLSIARTYHPTQLLFLVPFLRTFQQVVAPRTPRLGFLRQVHKRFPPKDQCPTPPCQRPLQKFESTKYQHQRRH